MTAAVATRRLYHFENAAEAHLPYATRRKRSVRFLNALLLQVWAEQAPTRWRPPTLTCGVGKQVGDTSFSYAYGRSRIELSPKQQSVGVLLHEITHCLGYGRPHGKGFVDKYLALLVAYGGCEEGQLRMLAAFYKLH